MSATLTLVVSAVCILGALGLIALVVATALGIGTHEDSP